MADPIAVIVRFTGNPDDLLERFEQARRLWIEAQDDYQRPAFYAACRTEEGVVVITGWETHVAHQAFGHGLGPHLEAAGLGKPENVERMPIEQLGWELNPANVACPAATGNVSTEVHGGDGALVP